MSPAEAVSTTPGKAYSFSVSHSVEAAVKRICGPGADAVIKKLKAGKTVAMGPHTFRPVKTVISPEEPVSDKGQAAANPDEAGGGAKPPAVGSDPGKSRGGKDK
jgi:hypothetical protein